MARTLYPPIGLCPGLRSALLLGTSLNENDIQVISGGLLILSVLVPNAASFADRARGLLRRGIGGARA